MNNIDKNEDREQNNKAPNYIKERVVEKPFRRVKRFIKKVIVTVPLGIIFGVTACVAFVYLKPILEKHINPSEETTTEETTTEEQTTMEEETTKVLSAEDLKELYNQISEITVEMKKSFVTINAYDGEKEIFQTVENEIISSGIIVKKGARIHILAMYENIKDMDIIKVVFNDNTSVEAVLENYDKVTGLAVLSVSVADMNDDTIKNIQAADFANSSAVSYSEPVVYIGNPFGMDVYETIGFINGQPKITTGMDIGYSVFRTDIFISECNDGFIFDIDGELLGIVNGGEKIVEAISASDVEGVVDCLNNGRDIVYMGIYGEAVTDEIREISGIDMPDGIYVTDVEKNSPAYISGIRKGDIISKIDGTIINNMIKFKSYLQKKEVGNTLRVLIYRQNGSKFDNYTLEVEITGR